MTDAAVDFFLENLVQLINCDNPLIKKEQVKWFYVEMQFLQLFLKDSEEKRNDQEVKDLVARIRDVTHKVENILDFLVFFYVMPKARFCSAGTRRDSLASFMENLIIPFHWREIVESSNEKLNNARREIKSIGRRIKLIFKREMHGIGGPETEKPSHQRLSRATSQVMEEEIVVGFREDTMTILDLLTNECEKQLKVIPIIGMPGLGKTTLTRKVYNDPLTAHHFYKRAWTYVSQVYHKRDLLLSIFSSAQIQLPSKIDQLNDDELGGELYKRLKGFRYLIVMDDLWNREAWNELERYFPKDNNGSRILITSQHVNVAVALHAKPYCLHFLNEEESWELLQIKAFRKETCPTDLVEIGKKIARKCRGLPLAIVVLSGLLAENDKTQDWWRYVAENVGSCIESDPKEYMDTLALSYNNLPHRLQPCFLYFGGFPEDYEISVKQLTWLWVAEGFIRQNEQKSREEVAYDYLMDLINRSLVVVSRKRSDGGVKACRVHDLLRDLCLIKAHEENFLRQIPSYEQNSSSSSNSHKQRRLCIHDNDNLVEYGSNYEIHTRSFLSFGRSFYNLPETDVSFVCQSFELLRVLNLLSIKILFFPEDINRLVHLRYLALYVEQDHEFFRPSEKFYLWNLETLIVDGPKGSLFLPDIREMVKLRHVHTRRLIEIPRETSHEQPLVLHNLQTIGNLNLYDGDSQILACFPNLKKLKCQCTSFPKFEFPDLNTLNLVYDGSGRFPHLDMLPRNLKSLTLSYCRLPWMEISSLGSLPNLEVLKLSYKAFEGPRWETNDGEFDKLKFLKFQGLDIQQWETSGAHFGKLQTLVFDDCQRLEEIPSCLGDMSTLEMIRVRWCSGAAEDSARQIQEEQQNMGNDGLEIHIYSLD